MFGKYTRTIIVRFYTSTANKVNIASSSTKIHKVNTNNPVSVVIEGKEVPRLDVKGFERENIRRLKPFIKFLLFQSVPIFFLMFLYKYLENKKLEALSIAIESDIVPHILRVIKGSRSFLLLEDGIVYVDISAIDTHLVELSQSIQNITVDKLINYISKESEFIGVKFKLNNSYTSLVNKRVRVLAYNPERYSYIVLEGIVSKPTNSNTTTDTADTTSSTTSGKTDTVLVYLLVDKVTVKFTHNTINTKSNLAKSTATIATKDNTTTLITTTTDNNTGTNSINDREYVFHRSEGGWALDRKS